MSAWEYKRCFTLLDLFGQDFPGKISGLFRGCLFLFLFLHFTSSKYVSVKSIYIRDWIKLNMFLLLTQRFIQCVLWYKITINRMFVKMKPIPILLTYIHIIIEQSWKICDWFSNHKAVFCVFSHQVSYFICPFSCYTCYLLIFNYSSIQLYRILDNNNNRK